MGNAIGRPGRTLRSGLWDGSSGGRDDTQETSAASARGDAVEHGRHWRVLKIGPDDGLGLGEDVSVCAGALSIAIKVEKDRARLCRACE